MSTTVEAVPFLLLYAAGVSMVNFAQSIKNGVSTIDGSKIHLDKIEEDNLLNNDFETNMVDRDTLLKTIEEHGATNIEIDEDNITCDCEGLHLDFYKGPQGPYYVNVSYSDISQTEEVISDIGNEYASNAQEISYNKIKERLEQRNMIIEDEEVYDDNTIVLTVNLE